MSDAELNRVQRYGGTRLVIFSYAVRIVGAGVGACAAALGVFGFLSLVRLRAVALATSLRGQQPLVSR